MPLGKRDTTRALGFARLIRKVSGDALGLVGGQAMAGSFNDIHDAAEQLISILTIEDARTGKRDPSKRGTKK